MVRALASESSCPSSGPGRGHCDVFLGKTLYYHSALFHLWECNDEFNAEGNLGMYKHPIKGRVIIFLVASCYRNGDKPRPYGPLARMQNLPYLFLWHKAALFI